MKAGLKPYTSYKPSGVEWLGEVPGHWECTQLGRIGRFSKGNGGSKEDEVDTGLPCVRYGDIYMNHKYHINRSRSYISPENVPDYTPIQYGDILFAGSGETIEEIGKSAVNLIPGEVYCGGDVILLRPQIPTNARFMGYAIDCFQNAHQKALMGRGITVMHIYTSQLKYMWLAFPSLPEQAAIVRYLDYVDRRIRRYVRAKEKLIALLKEEKQATINQAVTRGLDPNVSLVPPGVEWLGDVPEHWEVSRAKFFYGEVDERSMTGAEELMSVSHITGVIPRKSNVTMFMAESTEGYKVCRPFDIVINTMWAFMAALGVARQTGLVSPSYGVYRPRNGGYHNANYLDLLLRVDGYRAEYYCRSTGITSSRLRLYPDSFLSIPLLCPPLEEQAAIVGYLDKATADIDVTITRTRRQIELLREYQTRLISDVVTGKLDVREAAASLPDEADDQDPINESDGMENEDGDLYGAALSAAPNTE